MTEERKTIEAKLDTSSSTVENPEEVKVALTPLRITLGIVAIVVGIGSGLVMSSATLFR